MPCPNPERHRARLLLSTLVSQAALEESAPSELGLHKPLMAVRNTRRIGKRDMIHNDLTPAIEVDPETYVVKADGVVLACEPARVLPMAQRQKSRPRARLESGEEVAILLPRGTVMRHGDLLRTDDGRAVRVVARPECVLQVGCASAQDLARAAYHLGNRHVHLQIGDGWLRIADDHVLRHMFEGLVAGVTEVIAPSEPEAGAYGAGGPDGHGHGGVIHDHGDPDHAHDGHSHGI